MRGHALAQTVGGVVDGLRIGCMPRIMERLRDVVLRGRPHRHRAEGRIKAVVAQHGAQGVQIGAVGLRPGQGHPISSSGPGRGPPPIC